MNFEYLLEEEIVDEFGRLRCMEVGSPEYKVGVDGVTKLMEKAIEIEKTNIEREERVKQWEEAKKVADFERNSKVKQMEEDKQDRFIKNCIAVAGIVIPVVVTVWGTLKSFKFEEEGTITTIMGRGFINKLLPKK